MSTSRGFNVDRDEEVNLSIKNSLYLYLGVVILIFLTLIARVGWLQLFNQGYYQNQAEKQSTRWVPEQAPRGEIVDTNGNVLISNRPVYNLTINYLGFKDQDMEMMISELVKLVDDEAITKEFVAQTGFPDCHSIKRINKVSCSRCVDIADEELQNRTTN